MRVLVAELAGFFWILYAACALGALVYIVRALVVQRRLAGILATFERDVTVHQLVRLWVTAAAFVLLGLFLFASRAYLIPRLAPDWLVTPTPTLAAGLQVPSPSPSPTLPPPLGYLPTIVPTVSGGPSPAPTAAQPTATPGPTPLPEPAYRLSARFGNVAELLGYDLAATEVNPNQRVQLTLYWRALDQAGASNYVVFTHLLPPDISRILAQHDGSPAGGTRPTTMWVAGETISDYHELVFLVSDYAGPAQIAIGLYDPLTLARVPLEGGGDYILLPTPITVLAP